MEKNYLSLGDAPCVGKFPGMFTDSFLQALEKKETQKIVVFFSKREKTISKLEVLHEKLKTVLPEVILKKKNPNLQLLEKLKPIRLLLCNDSFRINIHLYKNYVLYFYQEI